MALPVPVGLLLLLRLMEGEALPVPEAERPEDREVVALPLTVLLPLSVEEGVHVGEPEEEGVLLPVPLLLAVAVADTLPVPELEGELEGVSPGLRDTVED